MPYYRREQPVTWEFTVLRGARTASFALMCARLQRDGGIITWFKKRGVYGGRVRFRVRGWGQELARLLVLASVRKEREYGVYSRRHPLARAYGGHRGRFPSQGDYFD